MTELVWLLGALLAMASGLWIVIGMRGQSAQKPPESSLKERRKFNAEVGTQQLRMLEQQLADGDIDQAQFEQARAQSEAALLKDLEQPDSKPWSMQPWSRGQLIVLPSIIVLLSLGVFWISAGEQHFDQSPVATGDQESIEAMVAKLAAKQQRDPDNLEGWIMLGRSYSIMQRYQEAADAFAQANRLTDYGVPDILVAQAESLGLAQGQSLAGEPLQLVERALELNPGHVRALWYGLIAASAAQDQEAQSSYLKRLEEAPDLPDQLRQILITDFGSDLQAQAPASVPGLSLSINVDVSPAVLASLPANGTLFVFAKAMEGPPMPLAVHKQGLPQAWPVVIELNDSMAMTQGMRLSDFDSWTIVARVSQNGQAAAQSGDWEGRLQLGSSTQKTINLTIDRQIP